MVDVHDALEGVANDRPDLVESSGLAELRRQIDMQLGRGAALAHLTINGSAVRAGLVGVLGGATTRLQALATGVAVDQEEFRKDYHKAYDELDEIGQRWRQARQAFQEGQRQAVDEFAEDIEDRFDKVAEKCVSMAESRKARAETISTALKDDLTQVSGAANRTLHRKYKRLVADFNATADDLLEKADQVGLGVANLGSLPNQLVWTERFESVGSGFAGLGGGALGVMGTMAAGAAAGALLAGQGVAAAAAAAAAAVPGVGWVIAGGVLLAGLGLREWNKRKAVSALIREIHRSVNNSRRKIVRGAKKEVEEHATQIDRALDGELMARIEQQRKNVDAIDEDRQRDEQDKDRTRSSLKQVVAAVEAGIQQIDDVLKKANLGGEA
jgi:hypothetical protein